MNNQSKWIFNPINYEKAYPLAEAVGVSVYTAQLLINREIENVESANHFLRIPHKLEMVSWDKKTSLAIGELIKKAIETQEIITVHGDYDVDGVTGAAVLSQFLKNKGANFNYYLPDRFGDGYGLNPNVIKKLAEQGTKILITADCGISNNDEIALAQSLGIKVVITDHHTLPEILPPAEYIFHPGLSKDKSFHILSGVGTAFQLVCDIDPMLKSVKENSLDDYVDLAVMGTIADISPLKGINREIVQFGIAKMKNSKRIGFLKLVEKANIKIESLSARDISFKISPRINAAGRMNKAVLALELLLAETEYEAEILSQKLEDLNNQRRELSDRTLKEVDELISKEVDLKNDKAIIIAGKDFHHGVIGIICSKVVEKYNRPAFIMANEGEYSRGSARSNSFNLVEALNYSKDLLTKHGGHHGAAGWSLKSENIAEFKTKILEYAENNLKPEDLVPKVDVEVAIPVDKIDYYLYRELQELAPFGLNNPEPVIGMKDCLVFNQSVSKNGLHLFFDAASTDNPEKLIRATLWHGAELYPLNEKIDLVYSVTENSWQGKISLQIKVNKIKNEEIETEKPQRKISKIEKDKTIEIDFPVNQLMTESIHSGYLTGSIGQHQVNFPNEIKDYKKSIGVIDKRSCINRFEELKNIFNNYSSENIFIFSRGKININDFKGKTKDSENKQKHLIIWDLPLKKEHLHHIMNMIEVDCIYMFFEKQNTSEKQVNAGTLREILKYLYINTDSMNNFVNNCVDTLNIEKKHISLALEFLIEAKYILTDQNKNFLKIPDKGIRLNELESYRKYMKDLDEYNSFCNIMLRGSLSKINSIIGVKI